MPAGAVTTVSLLLLLLASALPASPASALAVTDAGVLEPGVSRDRQELQIGHQVHTYRVTGTQPSTRYEVRVSHPAFVSGGTASHHS